MSRNVIDLRDLKAEARHLLPRDHPVRRALAGEPDVLPSVEGRAKLAAYARLFLSLREGEDAR